MWDTIDRLRQQPKEVRNRVAFFCALGVAVMVAGAWSLTLPQRLSSLAPQATTSVAAAQSVSTVSIWESVTSLPDSVAKIWSGTARQASREEETVPNEADSEESTSVWGAQTSERANALSGSGGRPILISTSSSATSSRATTTTAE